eukprot:TRINITY_DN20918_c0_g1_i1.p1 TRINITY_DN20918_c0_g1~~TRINITY_DN20918_c0_g1_i1.p1  ORF type:complete len:555 (+),score=120.96 TRINITY_DN20918_c0_g1_i1:91-1755(+)
MLKMLSAWPLMFIMSILFLLPRCLATEKDTNAFCKDWAAAGECTSNSAYMSLHCAASCEDQLSQQSGKHVTEEAAANKPSEVGHAMHTSDNLSQAGVLPMVVGSIPDTDAQLLLNALSAMNISRDQRLIGPACLALMLVGAGCFLRSHSRLRKDGDVAPARAEPVCSSGQADRSENKVEVKDGGAKALLACDQTDDSESNCDVSKELELSLAAEGQSLQSVRRELEQLRARLKSRDAVFDEREAVLSAGERRVAADAFALKEQSQRQGEEVTRLIKRNAELETTLCTTQAEFATEKESWESHIRELESSMEIQRQEANARFLELEEQYRAQAKAAATEHDSRIRDLREQLETQRCDANAKIMELEIKHESAQSKADKFEKDYSCAKDAMAELKRSAEEHVERLSVRARELDAQKRELEESERVLADRERKASAEVAAFNGQADSQRQAYYLLLEEVESLRAELGPLRAASEEVETLQEELHARSLALDKREEQLGIQAREQSARSRKDDAEIAALRAQASSQAERHFKLLEENARLRQQLRDMDDSTCVARKSE